MDGGSFDRLTRLFAGRLTRRVGLAGALGALAAGIPAAGRELEARQRRGENQPRRADHRDAEVIDEKRPCGPKPEDNRCRKDKECCTKYCKLLKGKQGSGRCRCIKRGSKCKTGQTCCGGATCQDGACKPPTPPGPSCAGAACSSDSAQGGAAACCSGLICESGSCAACVPNVCPTCAYTTIQQAIDALEGGSPNTAYIAAGTYVEDLTISDDMRLVGCGTVVVRNKTAGRRTLNVPTTMPATPDDAVVIELKHIHITTDTVAPNFGGGIGGGLDGNGDKVSGHANLTLSGSSRVTGCRTHDRGGGISLEEKSTLTLKDDAEVSGNFTDTQGGGGINAYGVATFLEDFSSVRNNITNQDGGGIRSEAGVVEMSGSSSISGNQAGDKGGGIEIYANDYKIPQSFNGMPVLAMKDKSSITGNTAMTSLTTDSDHAGDGGGGIKMTGGCDRVNYSSPFTGQPCLSIVLSGSATISGNSAGKSGAGALAGGISALDTDLILNDNASITGNFAYSQKAGASGSQVWLYYDEDNVRAPVVSKNGSSTIGEECRIFEDEDGVVSNCPA